MTVSSIISLAKISQYLALTDINNKKYLKGGAVDYRLPLLIYTVRKSVEWLYNKNPADTTLTATSNYLYALCGNYAQQAQYLTGNAGNIPLPTPLTNTVLVPVRIQKTIPDSYPTINGGAVIANGTTVLNILDAGILLDSLEVLIDAKPLNIGLGTEVSYSVSYANNILTITFNQGLATAQVLTIRYVKQVTI